MERGNRWFEQNRVIAPEVYPYYFLYSVERYWTFQELIDGNTDQVNRWYDEAARWLIKAQQPDGSWFKFIYTTIVPENCTCFAALFLLRSTKKSVEKVRLFGTGTLVGGRGLPKDSDLVRIQGGKVVSAAEASEFQKLLEQLGEGNEEEYAKAIGAVSELPPEEAKALVSRRAAKLRGLAAALRPDQRLAAVQALARAGTLDDVPTLIYAARATRNVKSSSPPAMAAGGSAGRRRGFQMPDDFDEGIGVRRSTSGNVGTWRFARMPSSRTEPRTTHRPIAAGLPCVSITTDPRESCPWATRSPHSLSWDRCSASLRRSSGHRPAGKACESAARHERDC